MELQIGEFPGWERSPVAFIRTCVQCVVSQFATIATTCIIFMVEDFTLWKVFSSHQAGLMEIVRSLNRSWIDDTYNNFSTNNNDKSCSKMEYTRSVNRIGPMYGVGFSWNQTLPIVLPWGWKVVPLKNLTQKEIIHVCLKYRWQLKNYWLTVDKDCRVITSCQQIVSFCLPSQVNRRSSEDQRTLKTFLNITRSRLWLHL